jgi:hypothetical protein
LGCAELLYEVHRTVALFRAQSVPVVAKVFYEEVMVFL